MAPNKWLNKTQLFIFYKKDKKQIRLSNKTKEILNEIQCFFQIDRKEKVLALSSQNCLLVFPLRYSQDKINEKVQPHNY